MYGVLGVTGRRGCYFYFLFPSEPSVDNTQMLHLLYLVAVVGADSSVCSGATGDSALIANGGFEDTDSQDM